MKNQHFASPMGSKDHDPKRPLPNPSAMLWGAGAQGQDPKLKMHAKAKNTLKTNKKNNIFYPPIQLKKARNGS